MMKLTHSNAQLKSPQRSSRQSGNLLKLPLLTAVLALGMTGCQSHYQYVHQPEHSAQQSQHKIAIERPATSDTPDVLFESGQTAGLSADPAFVVKKQQFCADFLSKINQKPLQLTFTGCSAGFYADHHSVIANYSVSGKNAFDVQEFLHAASGMPRLIKDCCSWESTDPKTGKMGGVIHKNGEVYYIRMQSKALKLGWGIASDLHNIPEFSVQAIYPLARNQANHPQPK